MPKASACDWVIPLLLSVTIATLLIFSPLRFLV